ncbi:hypothetical protein PCANC_28181 [Puccinia coronata f. sp. avenae]|uniref:Uncharacterized protein n=1 Tax=Puccinia coronata f. sp. avenae TaxID=200324 RepID=A0A2N5TJA7_9BASI|nr:hypothetical protein PCANC_28181 [Puccinia coronata f. sp. avenae]
MNYSSAEIRATPAAVIPPFEDIYFDSNGVLFRNGIAIVDQRGSIIRRSIVKRPPPTLVAPDATMQPASETRGWLIGDPACLAEATCMFNEAHDIIVDHFYSTTAPPTSHSASEPRAPTKDPVNTDSDPADAHSEPLLTNNQGNPVLTTYPFTNFSRPATPNPPGFFDPKDYHRLDNNQIHDLLRRDHEPAQFNHFAFGPQHLTDLYQSAMSAMVPNYTRFPPRNGAECADRVQTFKFITRRYHLLNRVMHRQ